MRDLARTVDDLVQLFQKAPEAWAIMFDHIFSARRRSGRASRPSRFVSSVADFMPPGAALDVCMGDGQNARLLASRGWEVAGFDISPRAVEWAAEQAGRAGLRIDCRVEDWAQYDYGNCRYDLICLVYAPTAAVLDRSYRGKLRQALRPAGQVLVEGFARDSCERRLGAEYDLSELRQAFDDWHIRTAEEVEEITEWGYSPARIVRLLASVAA